MSQPLALRVLLALIWMLLALGSSAFSAPSVGDGDPVGRRFSSLEIAAMNAAPSAPETVRSIAAIAVDGESGHALASRNADARLAPASLTKMMTALVAVKHAALTDIITATERSMAEPSIIGLDPGDRLTLEDMLYGLLLPSGNDAALAIAESVGRGSIDTFVGWMNEQAAAMGLKNTHFANPNGLDQAGHYSSARDLAAIGRALLAEPTLAKIVSTPTHTVPGPPLYFFRNSNPLLGAVPSVDGIKTGFTDDAGRCYAASAMRDGRRIIAVVLNSPNIALDAQQLLDAEFAGSHRAMLEIARPGFSDVRVEPAPMPGRPTMVLTGWEAPLLRGYLGQGETDVYLASRPLGRW
jgi:D-alanyl-D-alanine carboxypeptidase (penicillin-binding protein 5/6)